MTDSLPVELDPIDRSILDLLIANGRRTVADIAERVSLSPAPVARRIARLEQAGVITGYTALVDYSRLGSGFEAFTEIRFTGDTNVASIRAATIELPEVMEIFTIAGDPDALARIRVARVEQLQRVVDTIRRTSGVVGTKTLMVLGSWRRTT